MLKDNTRCFLDSEWNLIILMDPSDTEMLFVHLRLPWCRRLGEKNSNVANETRNAILVEKIASIEEVLSGSYLCWTFHFYLTLALKNYGPIKCNTYLSSTGLAALNAQIKTIKKKLRLFHIWGFFCPSCKQPSSKPIILWWWLRSLDNFINLWFPSHERL